MEKIQKNKHDIKCFLNIDNYKKSNLIKKDSEEISKEKSIGKDSYENKSSKELRNFSNFELEKITDKRKFEYQSNFNNNNFENNINNLEESKKIEISSIRFMQGNQDINCGSDRKVFPEEDIGKKLDISFNKFSEFKNSLEFDLKIYFIQYCFPKRNIKLRKNYDIVKSFSKKIYEKFDIFYYMQELKKSEYIQSFLLEEDQKDLINIMSKKFYRIWLGKNEEEIKEDLKENNSKVKKYILDAKNKIKLKEREIKILNNFIN